MYRVGVYGGAGVDLHGLDYTLRAFRNVGYQTTLMQAACLRSQWMNTIDILVIPGGRDMPYQEALQGEPNASIRRFVEQGGRYLGICAGAYYGAARIQFAMNTPLEISVDRELAFYNGVAMGPIYGADQFCYHSLRGARLAKVAWDCGVTSVYFNGGCGFVAGEGKIVATYQDLPHSPAAIVSCQIGKGKAVLCGVHPEYVADAIPSRILHRDGGHDFDAQPSLWNHLLADIRS